MTVKAWNRSNRFVNRFLAGWAISILALVVALEFYGPPLQLEHPVLLGGCLLFLFCVHTLLSLFTLHDDASR